MSLICGLVFLYFWSAANAAGQDAAGSDTGIATNVRAGIFASEQWLWFSTHPREHLRLVLDGAEVHSGPGPGMLFLNVGLGEERRFEITAERYAVADGTPASSPREVRVFVVHLDKRASPAPGSAAALGTGETGSVVFLPETGSGPDVYVASPVAPARVSPESTAAAGSGTRDDPFVYLDDAVSFAQRTGKTSIRLRGRIRLRGDLVISGNITVYGAPGPG